MNDQTNPFDPESALAMIDALASAGAAAFEVTVTNIHGELVHFHGGRSPAAIRSELPRLLASATESQYNVIVRPYGRSNQLIQLDDLGCEIMERLTSVAFLVLETSPGNYQAWVALPTGEDDEDFARRLRRGSGADLNASGSARIAGSFNFKEKYARDFPRVQLVHSAPGLVTSRSELEALGVVVAAQKIAPAPPPVKRASPRAWPSYQQCLDSAPLNGDGTGPDRSRADYTWCLIAADWGWGVEETSQRLMEVSEKARENGREYARRTADKAAAAVERRRAGPGPGPISLRVSFQGKKGAAGEGGP
jgi:hypothetical protein